MSQSSSMDQDVYASRLFIVEKICKSLGGTIVVSSIPNIATTIKATMKVYCVNKLIALTKQRKKLDKNVSTMPVANKFVEDGNGGMMSVVEDLGVEEDLNESSSSEVSPTLKE